eukprot:g1405.t1
MAMAAVEALRGVVEEVEALIARPAVQAAFDRRGAEIVAASTGSRGGWRPLQREAVLRAACSPRDVIISMGTGQGKTLLAPALASLLKSHVIGTVPLERLSVQMAAVARPVLGSDGVCQLPFGAGEAAEALRAWFGVPFGS